MLILSAWARATLGQKGPLGQRCKLSEICCELSARMRGMRGTRGSGRKYLRLTSFRGGLYSGVAAAARVAG
jgi:hypothetical protein